MICDLHIHLLSFIWMDTLWISLAHFLIVNHDSSTEAVVNLIKCIQIKTSSSLIFWWWFLFLFRPSKRISESWGKGLHILHCRCTDMLFMLFHQNLKVEHILKNVYFCLLQDIRRFYHRFVKCGFWQSVRWIYILIFLLISYYNQH